MFEVVGVESLGAERDLALQQHDCEIYFYVTRVAKLDHQEG